MRVFAIAAAVVTATALLGLTIVYTFMAALGDTPQPWML